MNSIGVTQKLIVPSTLPLVIAAALVFTTAPISGATTNSAPDKLDSDVAKVLSVEGDVKVGESGSDDWSQATAGQTLKPGDRLRTSSASRATVRLSNQSIIRVNEQTTLEIRSSARSKDGALLDLKSGSTYFFNRERPSQMEFRTRSVSGAIRGTEFSLETDEDGRTVVSLLDGEVALNNEHGEVALSRGEQGIVESGQPPRKTALIDAINIIQWVLYYPAILDPEDLDLSAGEKRTLSATIDLLRSGDLKGAVHEYGIDRVAATDAERILKAALLLSVGQVAGSEAALANVESSAHLSAALRKLVAAVKNQTVPDSTAPGTATEWLAESYYLQSRHDLEGARDAARQATNLSPEFGPAWVRLAELEFSFGRTDAAEHALDRGLQLSPKHAAGFSLQGYLLAARNKTAEAMASFDRAIELDPALADAWLGRGLCRIRTGNIAAGRTDLQVAATLEPKRSTMRSYLAKAWSRAGNQELARKELRLAKELDPNDPTPWLYSALMNEQENKVNEAVSDLERSKELNDNRRVFRSDHLLDQDRAVRSANLARIYRDAGMDEISVREASEAVNHDYANHSAHLFLANSYDALRDPRQVNLRYETPWMSELLVASLLAPVGAHNLSQNVSQQEYSRLFEGDHVGLLSSTEYFSSGEWRQSGSVYGTEGNTAFALDGFYHHDPGQRINNDFEEKNISARVKQQITGKDSLFFQVFASEIEAGDVRQYFDQSSASPTLRIKERQLPNVFAGYHREWSPGVHTLALAGRLHDDFEMDDPSAPLLITTRNGAGDITGVSQAPGSMDYDSELVAYTAELQQIFQRSIHTVVAGGRYQTGEIDTDSVIVRNGTTISQSISPDLERGSAYAYYFAQVFEPLQLSGGVSYDYLKYPDNNEIPPVSSVEKDKHQLSPKAGFRYTPFKDTTLRGAYTRSLGGVFYDTSVRLEPTQIAGFNQAYRSILPESVAGLVPGSEFESFGLALDQDFNTGTYVTVSGELLRSEGSRTVGTLDAFGPSLMNIPSGVSQHLDYEERTLAVSVNQLLGEQFALGASYRISDAELDDRVPAIPAGSSGDFSPTANRTVEATLQQLRLNALFNHRCGFFSRFESVWSHQSNRGYATAMPGDDFWQFNAFAGYRFARRRAEVTVGLLNITDEDYRLNPLNLYSELPRERTLLVSLRLSF